MAATWNSYVLLLFFLLITIYSTSFTAINSGEKFNRPRSNREIPSLVFVLIGNPQHQYWLQESIVQARIFNPHFPFYLIATEEIHDHSSFISFLQYHSVKIVNYSNVIKDDLLQEFRNKFMIIGEMSPTIMGSKNDRFNQYTTERFFAIRSFMKLYEVKNVLHIENDQSIYDSIEVLSSAALACNIDFAMSRLSRTRMAPAVTFIHRYIHLDEFLNFTIDAYSHGADYAKAVAGSSWVNDMSLSAAFFNKHEDINQKKCSNICSFPGSVDNSCIYGHSRTIVDAAALGQLVGGTFGGGAGPGFRNEDTLISYWDYNFSMIIAGNLRIPVWNGSHVFNLHIHSKNLEEWQSQLNPPAQK
jgi:hypothetical protein